MKTQLLATMVVGFAALGVVGFGFSTEGSNSNITNDAGFATGHVELVVTNPSGDIIQYQQTDNIIPNIGLQSISDLVLATSQTTGEAAFDTIAVGTATTVDGTGNTISDLTQVSNRLQDSSVANTGSGIGGDVSVSWDGSDPSYGNTITNGSSVTVQQVVLTTGGVSNNTTNQPILAYQADGVSVSVGSADTLTVTWTVAFTDN